MPSLRNVFTNPNARVLRDEMVDEATRNMQLEVTGLICYSV
ncbi:hypothetical protein [Metallumcola ferriviriculae]